MGNTDYADPADLFNATGLVVVVTGGGSGIGLAFATALVRGGASKVFLLGRRTQPLDAAAKELDDKIIIPVQCDVADAGSVSAAVKTIGSHTKYIDVLINNAGVTGPMHTDLYKAETIEQLSQTMLSQQDKWAQAYAINTTAVITVSGAFLPLLHEGNIRRGWPSSKRAQQKREKIPQGIDENDERTSQIVTVASIAAFNREVTAGLAYTASKAGAVMLAKSMSNFLAPFGIRSNVIAPGRFPSEMTAGSETVFPVNKIPHGSPGQLENLAACILSLVGKGGSYYNGDVRVIDGGRLSVMPATY